jgi:hypothetical protein
MQFLRSFKISLLEKGSKTHREFVLTNIKSNLCLLIYFSDSDSLNEKYDKTITPKRSDFPLIPR